MLVPGRLSAAWVACEGSPPAVCFTSLGVDIRSQVGGSNASTQQQSDSQHARSRAARLGGVLCRELMWEQA